MLGQLRLFGLLADALDVVRFRPQPMRLTGIDGAPLAAGAGASRRTVGRTGHSRVRWIIDFNAEGRDRQLVLIEGDNRVCAVDIDPAPIVRQPNAETPPSFACRICVPSVIAQVAQSRLRRKSVLAARAH